MAILYPWGYQRALVTEERLWELARFDLCDPATARRFKSWIRSRGGRIGIGGAVRFVQPDKPGFAEPGKSFHELQTWDDGKKNFAALDLVVQNGSNVHRSPTWAEVPKQGSGHPDITDFGVHANVTGEPWHLQAIEIDGWYTWANSGRRRPNLGFKLKEDTGPTPPPAPKVYAPGDRTLRVTTPRMEGIDVAFVQLVARDKAGQTVTIDGIYGNETKAAVTNIQAWVGLEADGIVGPNTWKLIITMSKPPAAPDDYPIGSRYLKLTSPTMKGTDVAWVQNVIARQGLAISTDGVYGRQTRDRVKILQGWNGLLQDGEVGPKTWEVLKKY